MSSTKTLSPAQLEGLQADLDAVRNEVMSTVGERDVAHIRRMIKIARGSAIAGRGLLMFGLDPVTWVLGVAALANAKILENMEIGHNVMHGQYEWTNDPELAGNHYEWDNVCDADNWRHFHNFEHHTYTNVLGKDRDYGYTVLRLTDEQPWKPLYLFQPLSNLVLAFMFQWGVGAHDLESERLFEGKMSLKEFRERAKPFVKKIRRQLVKDYVFFPLIALWNAPRVFAGNLAANMIRNLWSYAIIFCGHFPQGTQTFTIEETENETRGHWYMRQIGGSANIEGGRLFHIMSGHLSHQIEHHLFPDMPAHRYAEIAPRVREICAKYGLQYNSRSFFKQYTSVLARVFRYALPPRTREPALVAA